MQISEPAEYVILGLLKSQPMHGYEMFQQFQSSALGQIVHIEMSQSYAFLKKLERMTYIEAAEVKAQGVRPPRKIFHLTEQGNETFLQWLTLPVEKPRDIRILFLIKLYFAQRYLPDQIGSLLERQIDACKRFLAHLEALRSSTTWSCAAASTRRAPCWNGCASCRASLSVYLDALLHFSLIFQGFRCILGLIGGGGIL